MTTRPGTAKRRVGPVRLLGSASRSFVAAISVALWLVASSLSPAAAISNGSSLGFVNQPILGGVLPSGAGVPVSVDDGTHLKVAIYNGSGKMARIEGIPIRVKIVGMEEGDCLTGDVESTRADGIAHFTDLAVTCLGNHQLRALANDGASLNSGHIADSGPSATFAVIDAEACGSECADADEQGNTRVRVTSGDGDHVLLAVGGAAVDCGGYDEESQSVTFLVTNTSQLTTVRMTLSDPGKGAANKYQVCFSSPTSTFTSRTGDKVGLGEAGLLKDCVDVNPAKVPCVVDRFKENGNVVVIFTAPPGDPRVAT
jgi:hypothetical protein